MRFTKLLVLFLSMGFATLLTAQEVGLASYYSDKYQGRKTSSGENYNRSELTAAHKSLPFGTMVRVTRLDNNESVVVRVNDRMPDIKGRVIDLSGRAADLLDMTDEGVVRVKLQAVDRRSQVTTPATRPREQEVVVAPPRTVPAPATTTTPTNSGTTTITTPTPKPNEEVTVTIERETEPAPPRTTPVAPPRTAPTPRPQPTVPAPTTPSATTTTTARAPIAKTYVPTGLYAITLRNPGNTGYGVQVASMSTYDNALKQVAELQAKYFDNVLISIQAGTAPGERTFKIILGPFDTQASATRYKKDLKKKKIDGFVVPLSKF